MGQEIKIINLKGVNCYLIKSGSGFILIDTGFKSKRAVVEKELASAGCGPGDLKLIILTHGDSDHADNCAYLREKYGAKIAMHEGDAGMVERGDMGWNRKAKPDRMSLLFKIMSHVVKPGKFETFKPDLYIDESFDLSAYGLDAKVLHLPGHSKGSIGVLTAGRELFCGDLLYNFFGRPNSQFIDDLADFYASIEKLKILNVKRIYPGHGKAFPLERLRRRSLRYRSGSMRK
jgi:hydroxyacylglutathione hydrolase